jgi:Fe-S oxidoreductase
MGLLSSPLGTLYLYLRLKLFGFRGIKKYGSTIYLCTQCNKCHLAGLRRALMKSAVEHKAEPRSLTSLRDSILKYGSPYGKPEFRFALLPKTYTNTSSRVFFTGCTACYRAPELVISALALLESAGIEFSIMPDEICCGYPLYSLGYVREGYELARRNIEMLKKRGIKEIITLCPSCQLTFKTFYRRDFPDFNIQVKHILEVIKPKIAVSDIALTVHNPCHVDEEVAKLAWKTLEGCKVWKSAYPCCGAPLLSHHPETAVEIAQQIMRTKKGSYVTTYCPSCYLILSNVAPDKVIDLYTLLRVQSKDDVKQLKKWVSGLPELARSIRQRRLAPKSDSTPPET